MSFTNKLPRHFGDWRFEDGIKYDNDTTISAPITDDNTSLDVGGNVSDSNNNVQTGLVIGGIVLLLFMMK